MNRQFLKLFLVWLVAYLIISFYGEYVLSRDVNGFLQLFGFIGVIAVLIYVIGETTKFIKTKKKKNQNTLLSV